MTGEQTASANGNFGWLSVCGREPDAQIGVSMGKEYEVLSYTRRPLEDDVYSEKLAYSMHLALREKGEAWKPLNHNSGILYAKATQNPDGTLHAKSLKNPWIFMRKEGGFGVIAQRIETDGRADGEAAGKLLLFITEDLIRYQEEPLLDMGRGKEITDAVCICHEEGGYLFRWLEADGTLCEAWADGLENGKIKDVHVIETSMAQGTASLVAPVEVPFGSSLPEGAVVRNVLPISQEVAERLQRRFITPVNTANEVPQQIRAENAQKLREVKALARYSDGSSVEKRVDWFMDDVDWEKPGSYEVEGLVHQDRYEFPVAWHRADPCIGKWEGSYYFIATNDADDNHTLFIRKADTIPGLVTAQEVKILDSNMYPHLGNLLWAPEFHIIKDRLYIFHAGTPQEFHKEQSHVMALKKGGNPMKASDWEMPVRVVRKDGSPLYVPGITLDMTEFEAGGKYYVCWSQRQFEPVDQGAWLYIACIDPEEPWRLVNEPVLLSMPEYGWANNHTFVDEGPFALKRDGKIYLTFSSAAVDSTYVVGLLSADENADLLVPENWTKENYPLLSSRSVEGEYGTGHNSYIEDEDGLVWNAYHARPGIKGPRSSGIRRVHFNADGFPVLDMTEEADLKPELAWVKTTVLVP